MNYTYQYNLHSQINFWKQMVLHIQSYFYQTNKPYSYHSPSEKKKKKPTIKKKRFLKILGSLST